MTDEQTPAVRPSGQANAMTVDVHGDDVDAETVAAIAAAIELTWPRAAATTTASRRPPAWRFSGRWWSQPLPRRRPRPWH